MKHTLFAQAPFIFYTPPFFLSFRNALLLPLEDNTDLVLGRGRGRRGVGETGEVSPRVSRSSPVTLAYVRIFIFALNSTPVQCDLVGRPARLPSLVGAGAAFA